MEDAKFWSMTSLPSLHHYPYSFCLVKLGFNIAFTCNEIGPLFSCFNGSRIVYDSLISQW